MKMKRNAAVMAVLFLVVMIPGVFVTVDAFGADMLKMGYVDLRVALNESEAGKKAKVELESLIKTKQSAIDEKGKAIDKLKAELEKQSSVLSAEARKTKEDEIERAVRDYQRLVQDSQNEVKKRESEVTGSILKEIRDIVSKIGRDEGYSIILENVEGLVLYSKKDLDISDKVIKTYNEWKSKHSKK
jgi:outer membrane protein